MTKAAARRLLKVKSDYALAKLLGISRCSVSEWGRMAPMKRREQIRKLAVSGS